MLLNLKAKRDLVELLLMKLEPSWFSASSALSRLEFAEHQREGRGSCGCHAPLTAHGGERVTGLGRFCWRGCSSVSRSFLRTADGWKRIRVLELFVFPGLFIKSKRWLAGEPPFRPQLPASRADRTPWRAAGSVLRTPMASQPAGDLGTRTPGSRHSVVCTCLIVKESKIIQRVGKAGNTYFDIKGKL